jgi:hypothetical protein
MGRPEKRDVSNRTYWPENGQICACEAQGRRGGHRSYVEIRTGSLATDEKVCTEGSWYGMIIDQRLVAIMDKR